MGYHGLIFAIESTFPAAKPVTKQKIYIFQWLACLAWLADYPRHLGYAMLDAIDFKVNLLRYYGSLVLVLKFWRSFSERSVQTLYFGI